MRKDEFEALAGVAVSDTDYEIIEKVYMFHPTVRETSGKEEVAELYKSFGMAIFHDMLPRAERNCELEKELCHVQRETEQIRKEIEDLSNGHVLEKAYAMGQYGMETAGSGSDAVSNNIYEKLLNMDAHAFSRFIKNWTRWHLEDDDLCEGQVERIFQTPVSIYRQRFKHQSRK